MKIPAAAYRLSPPRQKRPAPRAILQPVPCASDHKLVDVQRTALLTMPRLEGHERIAGPREAATRRAAPGNVAVDAFLRTQPGDGPLTSLTYELRRLAADAQAREAAERVAQRDE